MSEITKILVRAPNTLGEQAASLSGLKYLSSSLKNPSIEVVVNKGKPHLYEYGDIISGIHHLPEEKDGPLGVFPWVHTNKEIFNIDTYIDLHGGGASASMGIALKAKNRLGYATAITKPTFTRSISIEQAPEFADERSLALCELLLDGKAPSQIIGKLPEVNEKEKLQLQSLGDFIFVGLRASEWQRHQDIWKLWFDELAGGNLVIAVEPDASEPELATWLKKRSNAKFFVIEKAIARTDLLLMHAARGIVTDSALYGNIAPYYGLKSAVLAFDLADYPSFSAYSPRPELLLEREKKISTLIASDGERTDIDERSAIDVLFRLFNL